MLVKREPATPVAAATFGGCLKDSYKQGGNIIYDDFL